MLPETHFTSHTEINTCTSAIRVVIADNHPLTVKGFSGVNNEARGFMICASFSNGKALHDWYEQKQKNYNAWAKVYPVHLNEVEYHKIDKQHAWCRLAEVTATPTLLLNGYRLPQLYQLTDLKYMLE